METFSDSVDWQLRLEIPVQKTDYNALETKQVKEQFAKLREEINNCLVITSSNDGFIDGEFLDTVERVINIKARGPTSLNTFSKISEINLLLHAINNFFNYVERNVEQQWRGNIIIHSLLWFMPEIMSCEVLVLNALDFGTFFKNRYNTHWRTLVPVGSAREDDLITTDFLFDQNQVIVKFWARENVKVFNKNTGEKTIECQWIQYRVQVQMQNIRRVILDVRSHTASDSLYLDLVNPPIIKRSSAKEKARIDDGPQKRWIKIKRGMSGAHRPGAGSSPEVLVENTTLRLEMYDKWDNNCKKFWHIISRLRHRCNAPIEFQRLDIDFHNIWTYDRNPYERFVEDNLKDRNETDSPVTHPNHAPFANFLRCTFSDVDPSQRIINKENQLIVHYLLEALISRGAIVKDHLFRRQYDWGTFLSTVSRCYKRNAEACMEALKRLMTAVDEQKRMYDINEALGILFEKIVGSEEECGLSDDKRREGYMLVPRVVITPTRNIRIQPEMCMGNRVLRNQMKHDPCVIMRVSFRDDDNTMMRTTKTSDHLLEETIKNAFDKGIFVAGRRYYYLGSSSSQMRDCGAYFMLGITETDRIQFEKQFPGAHPDDVRLSIKILRNNLGRFHLLKTAPKIMARLGQCFTQSRISGVHLERHDYIIEADIIGGRKKLEPHDPYCFTDGVGSISPQFARRMADDMHLNSVPSCFQYRFRGHKGVQVVDPYLEELANWAKKYNIPDPPGRKDIKGSWEVQSVFRPSQIKFESKRFERQSIEVVKFSGPTPVCLNKPLINIYDQVTAQQSYECHHRVTNRIEDLLNLQTRNIVRMLLEERYCRNKLKELPKRIDIDSLSATAGFELCCESFFSSLLRASVRFTILKQLRKEQIQIPPNLGRSMLGVNDITNRLQYGQVFVQYTNDIRDYSPHVNAAKTIVKGKIMVTKNPTSVGGDLRVFEAVDIPELRHLVDVIVFPVHGPRPMPDEMAGSDLDGDEYSVVWDPLLLIDHNVKPADYETEAKAIQDVTRDSVDDAVRDAYIDYVKKDNIGVISNALLFQSDLYGIDSKVVADLAGKANMALEFLKSGVAPERLRDKWMQLKEGDPNSEWLPPEKPERYPDYHYGNDYMPIYHSPRLTGRLYREIQLIEDVLKMVEEDDIGKELELDVFLEYEGWNNYAQTAKDAMDTYNARLRMVMETYGIKTEAELISGCICEMRNRITDKDQDDFSYYNQRSTIEARVTEIMKEAREKFFEEFGGWRVCTREDDYRDVENVFRRKCVRMTDAVKQKASAYYMTCYKKYKIYRTGQTRMLSFAWLAFDILGNIRRDKVYNLDDHVIYDKPVLRILDQHIDKMNLNYSNKRQNFINQKSTDKVLARYFSKYKGLDDILFVVTEWARFNKHLTSRFTDIHLLYLMILFATGHMGSITGEPVVYIDWIDSRSSTAELEEKRSLKNKGEILIKFFEFLSSRKFKMLKHLSFYELGMNSTFLRGEWLVIHQAAFKTYLTIAFSMNFDNLGIGPGTIQPRALRELDPFFIELPPSADLTDVENRLKKATGVSEVCLRSVTMRGRKDRAVVVCRGPLESCYKLKSLVAVRPSLYTKYAPKELSDILPEVTLNNIIKASENEVEL